MGKISYKIVRVGSAAIIGFLAPTIIYMVFRNTNEVYSTEPKLFIWTAGLVTAISGLLITKLLGDSLLQGPKAYFGLGLALALGYSGIAWNELNAGYYVWFGIPIMFVMQAMITSFLLRANFWRGFSAFAIMTMLFLGGHYVSVHREDFGVTNEYYFTYLIFLYPQISIFIALVGRGNST